MEYIIEGQAPKFTITIVDKNGDPVDMAGRVVVFKIKKPDGSIMEITDCDFTSPNIFECELSAVEKVTEDMKEQWTWLADIDGEPTEIDQHEVYEQWIK